MKGKIKWFKSKKTYGYIEYRKNTATICIYVNKKCKPIKIKTD